MATGTTPRLLVAAENGGLDTVTFDSDGFPRGVRQLVPFTSPGPVLAAVLSRPETGAALLAVADREAVRIWSRSGETWTETAQMVGHHDPVRAISPLILPDGRHMLLTGGDDTTLRLWHARDETPDPTSGDGLILACASDGAALVTGTDRGRIRWWDLASGQPDGQTLRQQSGVRALAWDGHVLATGGTDGFVRMSVPGEARSRWDRLHKHRGRVFTLVFFRSRARRRRFASGGVDSVVRVWDADTGRAVGSPLTGHAGHVRELVPVPDSDGADRLIAGCRSRVLRVWREIAPDRYEPVDLSLSSPDVAMAVAGDVLAIGTEDGTVELRSGSDLSERLAVRRLAGAGQLSSLAAGLVDGRWLLVAGNRSGQVLIHDLSGERLLRTVLLPLGQQALGLSLDSGHMIVRTGRGVLVTALDPRMVAPSAGGEPQIPLRQSER
ncbi:WD40 repeat domain-containing protein [Actinoplanes sp. CA-252034]|uniref:WD40 repeat domain-containing protein n=1 Tax=Actinoplanes sp. CA-252034 TaxID=3239906 RepID=UPI003D965332